jgi:uncharacterized membrane protein
MSWMRRLAWLFFAATLYLILEEAISPWIALPSLGNVGFTLIFVLFAITHCTAVEGAARTAAFFSVSAVVSYLMEEIGVRTGAIYGVYHYSDRLGAKLGHVPFIIPLAWFMMIYPSWTVAKILVRDVNTQSTLGIAALAAVAALVMTAWDLVMDPGMAAAGIWIWEQGGAYFGVPLHNYFGWLLTTFLVYTVAGWLWKKEVPENLTSPVFRMLPIIVYASFALRYVTAGHRPALQIIALFSMGTPALAALIQACMKADGSARASLPR